MDLNKWDHRFYALAQHVAEWSKDPSTKVGCVIVNPRRHVLGLGFNGFPQGVIDHADRLENREVKHMIVQHAEVNAILNAAEYLKGCTAYVTHEPCSNCTGVLIQAGISNIVTGSTPPGLAERFARSFELSAIMRQEAGIHMHRLTWGTGE